MASSTTAKERIQEVGDASNILVINNSTNQNWLLNNHTTIATEDRQTENLLSITLTQSAQQRYKTLQNQYNRSLPKTGIISVDAQTALTSTPISSTSSLSFDNVWINTVSPFNLMRVGLNVHTYLQEQTEEGSETTVFIHALDEFLEYTDTEQMFHFLHVLTEEIATNDSVGYYQIRDDYDQQAIATLRPLFDVIVDVSNESTYSVSPPSANSWSATADQNVTSGDSRSEGYVESLSQLTPWLWLSAIITFGFGDILTTFIGLRSGIAVEASPVAADVIAANGLGFIYVVKSAVFGLFYLVWRVTPSPHRVGIPFGLSLLGGSITVWNLGIMTASTALLFAPLL